MRKKFLAAAAIVLAATSCIRGSFEEPSFNDGLSLSIGGEEIFKYDPQTWQAASGTDNKFVMQRDDEKCWYSVSLDGCPTSAGEEFSGELTWKKEDEDYSRRQKNLSFKVSAINGETGMVHLWAKDKGVAVMIRSAR